ncbi:hypothetical protein IC614_03130 [Allosphingosinicella flava]|uniref:Uncharacterized protein n=1 Tax=Allosphingosinicella flava TaxID=2771430 RepID=A0A7T2GKN2_9SPHN|nr:hypothetical protein [Sphingosinicella flava]QPQ55610.1 hypothetical protein IC614_03130 [Sphingosinicella flava]
MIVAEAFHPSEYIADELDARGWSTLDLARRMPGDVQTNLLAVDLYLTVGPENRDLRLGDCAASIGDALGVSAAFFNNLEAAWLDTPS